MIRKPTEEDFRESAAVTALRESKKIAIEGSAGAGQGFATGMGRYFGAIYLFMILPAAFGGLSLPAMAAMATFFSWQNRAKLSRGESKYKGQAVGSGIKPRINNNRSGRYELNISSVSAAGIGFIVPSLFIMIFFGMSRLESGSFGATFVVGIMMMMLGFLVTARMFGDRTVLVIDNRTIKVTGLFNTAEMQLSDISDVYLHSFSFFDAPVLVNSGSWHNLVIEAKRVRLGGPSRLLVPIEMLDMTRSELEELVYSLLEQRNSVAAQPSQRAEIEEIVLSVMAKRGAGEVPTPFAPQPSRSVPDFATRFATTPVVEPPAVLPTLVSYLRAPEPTFDPDKIMERYLAEREHTIQQARPDLAESLPLPQSGVFQRKAFGKRVA